MKEVQAPKRTVMQHHQRQERDRCEDFGDRRKSFCLRNGIAERLLNVLALIFRYSRMLSWRVGDENIPKRDKNECYDGRNVKSPSPSQGLDDRSQHHPRYHIAQSSAKKRRHKSTLFVFRAPERDEIVQGWKDGSLKRSINSFKLRHDEWTNTNNKHMWIQSKSARC